MIWAYVAGILFLNRELLGREGTYLLDSYRFPTLALLGVFVVVMRIRGFVRTGMPANDCRNSFG